MSRAGLTEALCNFLRLLSPCTAICLCHPAHTNPARHARFHPSTYYCTSLCSYIRQLAGGFTLCHSVPPSLLPLPSFLLLHFLLPSFFISLFLPSLRFFSYNFFDIFLCLFANIVFVSLSRLVSLTNRQYILLASSLSLLHVLLSSTSLLSLSLFALLPFDFSFVSSPPPPRPCRHYRGSLMQLSTSSS